MKNRKVQIFLSWTFCAVLGLGLTAQVLRLDFFEREKEKRILAEFPSFSKSGGEITEFIKSYNLWFSDHFGLRNGLLLVANVFRNIVLRSSSSESVLFGRDGWLFLRGDSNLDDYRNARPYTSDQLDRFVTQIETRKQKLNDRGIGYVFIVLPNSHTIYGEYLPKWLSGNKAYPHSKLDQLIAALKQRNIVHIVDIREQMRLEKLHNPNQRLYRKTDTHWNIRGSYIGYRALMEEIATEFRNLGKDYQFAKHPELVSFPNEITISPGGDLAGMLGLTSLISEENPILPSRRSSMNEMSPYKALVFCDSFFGGMTSFFSRHFQSITRLQIRYDQSVVDEIHPDLVIDEMVERTLFNYPIR